MRRVLESLREETREFFGLPHLDAMEDIAFVGAEVDKIGAVRGDPSNCVFNRTCRRAGLPPPLVFGTKTWVKTQATRALIEFNKARGVVAAERVSPGDKVVVVYGNDTSLQTQIRLWDKEGCEFTPGPFTLRVPNRSTTGSSNRNKANPNRRQRADSRAEGVPPKRKRTPHLMRWADACAAMTREVADPPREV